MKKLGLLILLLVLPFTVNAATINVKSLDATADGATINYNGEMEDGSVAVLCKLYKGDEELDFLSSQVNSNKFEGTLTAPTAGTYIVKCANYEGGEIKEVEVTTTQDASTNPTTGDPIYTYIAIGAVALIIVGVIVVILTKKKKDK